MGDKIEAKGLKLDAEEETSALPRNGVKGHGVPRERGRTERAAGGQGLRHMGERKAVCRDFLK